MAIVITLDSVLKRKRMTGKALAEKVGISQTQMSMLRSGKVRGIRFSTLKRICAVLQCQPGDVMVYQFSEEDLNEL
ncbi:MAG: helix-turn-helix domain-containing protein [Woeseiaceae bacterium]